MQQVRIDRKRRSPRLFLAIGIWFCSAKSIRRVRLVRSQIRRVRSP